MSNFFSTLTASGTKDMIATKYIEANCPNEYKSLFIEEIYKTNSYRELLAEELPLIQGFPKSFVLHDSYQRNVKLFGNSVSVPVIKAIGVALINSGCFGLKHLELVA